MQLMLFSTLTLTACSGSDSGGAAGAGGGSTLNTGGSVGAVGGTGTGGAQPTGGTATQGGSAANGGAAGPGGATSVGGTATTGGTVTTGGVVGTGGVNSTGGSAASGGSKSVGGSSATGGSKAAAGATATGGATSTGACVESTCGSHKWPCWKMPNPASAGLPNPASYTDLGNGAVRDNITCLVWEKSPGTTQVDGATNLAHCASQASSNYAGFSDWRVPTRVEMASIVDFTRNPGYPTAMTNPSAYYRTISNWYETITGQNSSGYAWIYGADGFTSNAYAWTSNATVRCVRGNGTGEGQNDFAVEPTNHYTVDTTAGETTDNYTGLIWQQGSSAATMDWASAANYCTTLNLNGHTWRVPSVNELASIVNEALVAPAVNRTAFPNTHYGSKSNNWYWANAEYVNSTYGWAINYDDGFTGYNAGASGAWNYFTAAYVKCVR